MYFVANKALPSGSVMTVFGPFPSSDAAVKMIEASPIPGEYVVYGPAEPRHGVTISAPTVTSTPIGDLAVKSLNIGV